MSDDENAKLPSRIFFVEIILGIIIGVFGNLLVTSSFELANIFNFNENPIYLPSLIAIFFGSIIVIIFTGMVAWRNLKETF